MLRICATLTLLMTLWPVPKLSSAEPAWQVYTAVTKSRPRQLPRRALPEQPGLAPPNR